MLRTTSIDIRQIYPLTDFLRNAKTHIARLKESGGPEVLTVNGKAEIVVQDAATYQELLDRLERAELVVSLRHALAEAGKGQDVPLEALEAELNERYGI